MRSKIILTAFMLWCGLAHAATIEQPLADAAQEATARAIFLELRCVTCEGQSLADSDATLARQMRAHIRTLIAQGKSSGDVQAFFRDRYGDQILMTPPVKRHTALLWLAPLLLLCIGSITVWHSTQHANGDKK